jgi:hypothetical protein
MRDCADIHTWLGQTEKTKEQQDVRSLDTRTTEVLRRIIDIVQYIYEDDGPYCEEGHILIAERQFDCLPPSRHEINPRFRIKQSGYKSSQQK